MFVTKLFLLCIFVGVTTTTNEHWFIFDRYQFQGFYTPLFTLTATGNEVNEEVLSFTLSTYDRSVIVNINQQNYNETIKLNIERADLLYNTMNHMIFIVLRQNNKLETYVNCKLIDAYGFYSMNKNSFYTLYNITENIDYFELASNSDQDIFDRYSCKQPDKTISTATTIQQPLIRKMQNVIQKVQRRKLRSRRQYQQQIPSFTSLTLIYKPNFDNNTSSHHIFNIPQLKFHVEYNPTDHLFNIRFHKENQTEFILYADKSTDRVSSSDNKLIVFLHITSTMVTCYVNCELIDQEFILETVYIENFLEDIMKNSNQYEYNRQTTLIVFNKTIDQIGEDFVCVKLDKKNQDLLPEKYALRKFTNALDILVNSLDSPMMNRYYANQKQNISPVNIPFIDGFGSFKVPTMNSNNEVVSTSKKIFEYDQICSIDDDCNPNQSSMKCQSNHCICQNGLFWSPTQHRCIICHDTLIGSRCFRLSNHKSNWYEVNDYCQTDEEYEYTMKFATNLNQTHIQYLKQNFLHNNDDEHIDYIYWIGATSHFNGQKPNYRTKRDVPTTVFRWYENNQIAQLNSHELWCSRTDYLSLTTINNNQLCVSLTSCGLYADDCQRNYRFICEAV